MKQVESGNFITAWGGISSLQFSLPITWTGALERNFSVNDNCKWMCDHPAKFLKMEMHKGKIAKGYDADLCIWMPAGKYTLKEEMIHHRHKITPYLNQELYGIVKQSYLHGTKVYDDGKFMNLNEGQLILEKQHV